MRRWILLVGLIGAACDGDDKGPSGANGGGRCVPGTERCRCDDGDECNAGLVCGSGLCVRVDQADGSSLASGGHSGSTGGRRGSGGSADVSDTGRSVDAGDSLDASGPSEVDGGRETDAGAGGKLGSGGAGGTIGTDDAGGVKQPVALYLMLDRSASMVELPPGASIDSWTSATNGITVFVQDAQSGNLDIGLGTFPVGPNNTFNCDTGADCGTSVVPIAPVKTNALPMIAAMGEQRPAALALTPTECALRGMVNHCLVFQSNSTSGEKCVAVLVTDGTATQCNTNNTDLAGILAEGKAKGVTSFVLGLPGADLTALNQYAMAGGSGAALDVTAGPQAFITALNSIRGKIATTP